MPCASMMTEPDSAQEQCCICLDSLSTPGLGCQKLPCGHTLHERCVNELRQHGVAVACPLCREHLPDLPPVDVLYGEAFILKLRQEYTQAFQKLEEVLEIQPSHGEACRMKASFFDTGNGVPQSDVLAAEWYERALQLGLKPYNNLGQIYQLLGRVKEGEWAQCYGFYGFYGFHGLRGLYGLCGFCGFYGLDSMVSCVILRQDYAKSIALWMPRKPHVLEHVRCNSLRPSGALQHEGYYGLSMDAPVIRISRTWMLL